MPLRKRARIALSTFNLLLVVVSMVGLFTFKVTETQTAASAASPGQASGQTATIGGSRRIADVPPEHWAYEAVQTLIDHGYLTLYSDGTFQGEKPVDRFTFAEVVARLLKEMAARPGEVTNEDLALLRKLSGEFRDELVQLHAQDDSFQRALEEIKAKATITQEDLTKVTADVQATRTQLGQLAADLQTAKSQQEKNTADLATLGGQVTKLNELAANLAAANQELKGETQGLKEKIASWEQQRAAAEAKLRDLDQELTLQKQALAVFEDKLTNVQGQGASLGDALKAFEGRLNDLGQTLKETQTTFAAQSESLQGRVQGLEQKAASLEAKINKVETILNETGQKNYAELTLKLEAERKAALIREEELQKKVSALEKELADFRSQQRAVWEENNRKLLYGGLALAALILILR